MTPGDPTAGALHLLFGLGLIVAGCLAYLIAKGLFIAAVRFVVTEYDKRKGAT